MLSPQDSSGIDALLKANNFTPPADPNQPQDWYSQVLEDRKKQQQEAMPTTDNPQYENNGSAGNKVLGGANTAASVLGIQKAGAGLATAGLEATGQGNQGGDSEAAAAKQLSDIMAKYPVGSPERKAAVAKYQQLYSGGVPSQAEIDPGTQLSNKEVLGSFGNVALDVVSAGSLPGEGAATGALSKGLPVAETLAEGTGATGNALKALKLGAKVVEGGTTGYAMDKAQQANNNEEMTAGPGLGTVVGGGLPVVSAIGGAILKRIAGLASGAGTDVIQRAIDNPDEVNAAIKEYATTPEAKQSLVDRAKSVVNDFLHQRGQEYGSAISSMESTAPISKDTVTNSFMENLKGFGGKVNEDGELVFNNSKLTSADKTDLVTAWNDIKGWTDVTPQGMDNLRQNIGNNISDFKATKNSRASVVLGKVKDALQSEMSDKIPGYSDTLANYGKKTQTAQAVLADLTSNSKSPTTQLNKLMGIFKKDPSIIENLKGVMGEKEANSFLNEISGAILTDWMPHGGNLEKMGKAALEAGALHFAGPAALPAVLSASPRLDAIAATGAGKAIKKGAGTAIRRTAAVVASKKKIEP